MSKSSLRRWNLCNEERADAGGEGIMSPASLASPGVDKDWGFRVDRRDNGRGGDEKVDRAESGGDGTTELPGDKEGREEASGDGKAGLPSSANVSNIGGGKFECTEGGLFGGQGEHAGVT